MQPEKLQRFIDKQEIIELSHRYCRAVNRRDYQELATLYCENAIESQGDFFQGLAKDFVKKLGHIQKNMPILHHNITTTNIFFDENDAHYAEGEIYVLALHQVQTDTNPIDLFIGGRYLDRYKKINGQWFISFRSIIADWANLHNPSIIDMSNPMVSMSHQGKTTLDDPSYRLLKLT